MTGRYGLHRARRQHSVARRGAPRPAVCAATDGFPASSTGTGWTPLSVAVERRDLRVALSGAAGVNTVLDLTVDGTVYPAIVKDLQRHPVRRNVIHVDFIQVNLDEEITVAVPLRLVGEAKNVEQEGGLVDPAVDSIEVVTTPRNIPDEFVVDVSEMTMDTVIRLGDIPMPAGVTATGDPESPVVTVLTMRAEVAEIEAADAEVAAEQEAEGEAAAEGAPAEGCRGRRRGWRGRQGRGRAATSDRVKRRTPFDWLIVGLGNPGKEFARTRHNVGEEVVAELARRRGDTLKSGRNNALVAESRIGEGETERRCVLAFPLTYVNESGQAVGSLARRYGIDDPEHIVIVHDELDLPPATLRVKAGGGLGGPQRAAQRGRTPRDEGLPARADRRRQAAVEGAGRRPRPVATAQAPARAVRRRRAGGRRRRRGDRARRRRGGDEHLQHPRLIARRNPRSCI